MAVKKPGTPLSRSAAEIVRAIINIGKLTKTDVWTGYPTPTLL
jgi:hypothetical protein